VAVDAVNPWGRGYLIPRGRLREKKENLSRADLVVLTRCNQTYDVHQLKKQIESLTDAPVVCTEHVVSGIWRSDTWQELPVDSLHGKSVYAFSGIANPASFEQTLLELGASVVGVRRFVDHHFFSTADIDRIEDAASKLGAEFLVTTDKDAVRLPQGVRVRTGGRVLAVGTALEITQGAELLDGVMRGALARRGLSMQ
jgi:tetraacyldisaccharide 4'-kinase